VIFPPVPGSGLVIVCVPDREPCPIVLPVTLYSAITSISELVRIESKNWLIFGIRPA
jgi:hypothetical protein